jgi:hypothetical protein
MVAVLSDGLTVLAFSMLLLALLLLAFDDDLALGAAWLVRSAIAVTCAPRNWNWNSPGIFCP